MLDTSPSPMTGAGPGAARRPNPWALEILDVITLRRWILAGVAVSVGVVGSVVAALLPEVLPPRPIAGAAVGVAGYFLGLAAAIGVDAADPIIRGRRHVETTGAVIAASITGLNPNPELMSWVEQLIREQKGLRIAVTATGSDAAGSGQLSDDLGVALARRGLHVLIINLEKPDEEWPGASEVCGGEANLSDVVEFHPSLQLARLGPGRDRARALSEFTMLASSLPMDVDVLVVALPGLSSVGTLPALAAVDRALLLASADRTSRVELLAALDSVDEIRMPTDVVLVRGLPIVEAGLGAVDPIDLWSGPMSSTAESDVWRGEMVTIVAPPRREDAEASAATAAGIGSEMYTSDGPGRPETPPTPSTSRSTSQFQAPPDWRPSQTPSMAGPSASHGSSDGAPAPTVQPSTGGRSWQEPATSPETSPPRMSAVGGEAGTGRYQDEQREPGMLSTPDEARLDDSESALRLAAWVNSLGEDESSDQAGGQ